MIQLKCFLDEKKNGEGCIYFSTVTYTYSDSVIDIHPFCEALIQFLVLGQGLTEFATELEQQMVGRLNESVNRIF